MSDKFNSPPPRLFAGPLLNENDWASGFWNARDNARNVEYIRADIAEAERDAARAERDNLQAELIGVLNRETASLARWEDKLEVARAELARVRGALEDQAEFLDQMHRARMTGLGRDPDKYTSELSAQRDKLRALTTQEPKT